MEGVHAWWTKNFLNGGRARGSWGQNGRSPVESRGKVPIIGLRSGDEVSPKTEANV